MEVPDGYTVNVHENTGNTLYFVLPPNSNGELSDLELEMVAGGKGELIRKVNAWINSSPSSLNHYP